MGAPTNAAYVKKVLANSEPSTHGGIATAPGSAQGVLGGRYYKGGDRCSNSGSLAMFAAVRRGVHLTGGVFGGK
jgi:hypothetical protein